MTHPVSTIGLPLLSFFSVSLYSYLTLANSLSDIVWLDVQPRFKENRAGGNWKGEKYTRVSDLIGSEIDGISYCISE